MKRRVLLTQIKKDVTAVSELIILDPIDKGVRKFKREVRKILNTLKDKKKIEKFHIVTTVSDSDLLAELYLSFPKIEEVCILEMKISKKE